MALLYHQASFFFPWVRACMPCTQILSGEYTYDPFTSKYAQEPKILKELMNIYLSNNRRSELPLPKRYSAILLSSIYIILSLQWSCLFFHQLHCAEVYRALSSHACSARYLQNSWEVYSPPLTKCRLFNNLLVWRSTIA